MLVEGRQRIVGKNGGGVVVEETQRIGEWWVVEGTQKTIGEDVVELEKEWW